MIFLQCFFGLAGFIILSLMYFALIVCEYSFIRISISCFREALIENLKKDKALVFFFTQSSNRLLWTLRLGMGLLTFLSSFFLFLLLTLVFPERALSELLIWLIAFLFTVYLHFLCGDFFAKSWASANPLKKFRRCAGLGQFIARLTSPLLILFIPFVRFINKAFKINFSHSLFSFNLEKERTVFAEALPPSSHLLHNIFERALVMQNLTIQNILLPRNQVWFFDLDASNEENIRLAKESRHTRFPLCKGDLDNCIGIIHIKDLFNQMIQNEPHGKDDAIDLMSARREVIRIKPDTRLDVALEQFLLSRSHIALVVDEFGGAAGVVTLESILEELVGDIHDEFDSDEKLSKPVGNNEYEVSGLIPLHDLEEQINMTIEKEENVSTLSGLINSTLGRIPKAQEQVDFGKFKVIITEVDETRIITARIMIKS